MGRPKADVRDTRAAEDAAVGLVAAIFERACGRPPAGEVWIGDDAAVVDPPPGRLVLATDAAVGGVHADLSLVALDDLGWKGLTATLSDIAAMGARPCHALMTYCVPPGTDLELLASGTAAASECWQCPVVGGDVTESAQVMVSAAATGVLDGPWGPVLRSGASPGDWLFVTGPLGASAAGLRLLRSGWNDPRADPVGACLVEAHRRPRARLAHGVVARACGATAMMDVSDGLAIDLHRLAEASGVGLAIDVVPIAPGASEQEALAGGEDFELIVAHPDPERLAAACAAAGISEPTVVGRCTADPSRRLLRTRVLPRAGYEHRLG